MDIVFLSDTSIRPTSKPSNLCRSDSRIRHSNHSQIFSRCGHRLFCRIRVHVGRIPESDVSIIPEFSQCANIGFLSDTSIRPTSKPNNPRRSDSRIRRFNHSRISAMCGHRFFVGYLYPTFQSFPKMAFSSDPSIRIRLSGIRMVQIEQAAFLV